MNPHRRTNLWEYRDDYPQTSRGVAKWIVSAALVVAGAVAWIVVLATAVGP